MFQVIAYQHQLQKNKFLHVSIYQNTTHPERVDAGTCICLQLTEQGRDTLKKHVHRINPTNMHNTQHPMASQRFASQIAQYTSLHPSSAFEIKHPQLMHYQLPNCID